MSCWGMNNLSTVFQDRNQSQLIMNQILPNRKGLDLPETNYQKHKKITKCLF